VEDRNPRDWAGLQLNLPLRFETGGKDTQQTLDPVREISLIWSNSNSRSFIIRPQYATIFSCYERSLTTSPDVAQQTEDGQRSAVGSWALVGGPGGRVIELGHSHAEL